MAAAAVGVRPMRVVVAAILISAQVLGKHIAKVLPMICLWIDLDPGLMHDDKPCMLKVLKEPHSQCGTSMWSYCQQRVFEGAFVEGVTVVDAGIVWHVVVAVVVDGVAAVVVADAVDVVDVEVDDAVAVVVVVEETVLNLLMAF